VKKGAVQKKEEKESALQKIRQLFDAAAVAFPESAAKANMLVGQAHKLMLRSRVSLPSVLKRRFCRKCHSLWVPGKSVRVRISKGKVIYSCLGCRQVWRFPLD
jgi:ribonuclease P protein subunit RPR2